MTVNETYPPLGANMNLNLHHIGIAVEDISRATEDYRRRLGCELEGGPSTTLSRPPSSSSSDFQETRY